MEGEVTSILMLAYCTNGFMSNLTRKTVRSLARNTVGEYELVLLRNGGKELDWTLEDEGVPGKQFSTDNGVRLGLASAYNKAASLSSGDVLCVLHNDVLLPQGWNVPLEDAARKGCIAFPMVDESHSHCNLRGIVKTEPWQTTGSCFMLSRETWEKLGGYDEGFRGFHWEDTDLFTRAHFSGIRLVRCDVTVEHYRGATRTYTKSEEKENFEQNMECYKKKHGSVLPYISVTPQEV